MLKEIINMEIEFGKYCLHTHSFYCGHAVGQLSEYCDAAIESNIEVLGFSEHCPVKENRWQKSRMDYEMMENYLEDVKRQKDNYENLNILSGFECDYFKEYKNYLSELKERVDYLITGVHYLQTPTEKDFPLHHYIMGKKELFAYSKQYIDSIESGLFSFAAHPDLFAIQYHHFDKEAEAVSKDIIECAISYDIPLEVNGNGLLKDKILVDGSLRVPYPIKEFWNIAQNYPELKVIGSPDAHDPKNIKLFTKDCSDFISPFAIEFNSLDFNANMVEEDKLKFI
jgi:histidinol-phosphatase (PHP family)